MCMYVYIYIYMYIHTHTYSYINCYSLYYAILRRDMSHIVMRRPPGLAADEPGASNILLLLLCLLCLLCLCSLLLLL